MSADHAWQAALRQLGIDKPGFEVRPDQLQMLHAVAAAWREGRDLVVEAGTGTGKTLAYLLPLLAARRKAVISTATRQLQNQIVAHDLPEAVAATGSTATIAVLQGRSNYLCHERVERQLAAGVQGRRAPGWQIERVAQALRSSEDGLIGDIEGIADDDPVWPDVTSTTDTCLGGDCGFVRDCFVLRARRRAHEADVVVVNHHLLLADYALRERVGDAALLPSVEAIVIDEAHALEDVVATFFGRSVTTRRVERLWAELREAMDLARVEAAAEARDALPAAVSAFGALFEAVPTQLPSPALDAEAVAKLAPWRDAALEAISCLWRSLEPWTAASPTVAKQRDALVALEADVLEVIGARDDGGEVVRWAEQRGRAVALKMQPIEVAPILRRTLLATPAPRLFCSATLAVGRDFSTFCERMGLPPDVQALQLAGPFDYPNQALLVVPQGIADPFAPGRDQAVADAIAALVAASGGGAFALFSSFRQMRDAHARLQGRLGLPVLLQGAESKRALLERFRADGDAVLFATMGFWQGIDVPGDALRLVILDKIPFPPPDDPVFAARAAALEARGRSSFGHLSVPAAAIALRQGFGRLIRRRDDRGVVAILDPRLLHKPYGRRLLAALPPAKLATTVDAAAAFFAGQPLDPALSRPAL